MVLVPARGMGDQYGTWEAPAIQRKISQKAGALQLGGREEGKEEAEVKAIKNCRKATQGGTEKTVKMTKQRRKVGQTKGLQSYQNASKGCARGKKSQKGHAINTYSKKRMGQIYFLREGKKRGQPNRNGGRDREFRLYGPYSGLPWGWGNAGAAEDRMPVGKNS